MSIPKPFDRTSRKYCVTGKIRRIVDCDACNPYQAIPWDGAWLPVILTIAATSPCEAVEKFWRHYQALGFNAYCSSRELLELAVTS